MCDNIKKRVFIFLSMQRPLSTEFGRIQKKEQKINDSPLEKWHCKNGRI